MVSYVYNNRSKSSRNIFDRIMKMFEFTLANDNENDEFMLANEDMLINIDKKRTNILLYNTNLNISEIRNIFMER